MTAKRHSIYILGSQAAGKSTFLAGLGILSDADRATGVQLGSSGEGQLQLRDLAASLRRGIWPPSTTGTRFIDAELRFQGRDISVRWVDYPGERFVQHYAEGGDQLGELPEELREADYFLIALDPAVDLAGEKAFAGSPSDLQTYKDRLGALLHALSNYRLSRGEVRPLEVAVMIMKADQFGEQLKQSITAETYFEQQAPQLLANLKDQFPQLHVFAVSAVGNTVIDDAGRQVPAQELEPWGYQEIFSWVVHREMGRRWKSRLKRLAPVAAIMIALIAVGFMYRELRQNKAANALWTNASPEEFRRALPQARQEDRQRVIDDALSKAMDTYSNPSATDSDYESRLKQLEPLKADGYRSSEIVDMEKKLLSKLEEARHNAIVLAKDGDQNELMRLVGEYYTTYPNGSFKDEIDQLVGDRRISDYRMALEKLKGLRQKAALNALGLSNYRDGMLEFANKHVEVLRNEDGAVSEEITKVSGLAARLAAEVEGGTSIKLESLGQLTNEAAYLRLKIEYMKSGTEYLIPWSPEAVQEYKFDGTTPLVMKEYLNEGLLVQVFLDWDWGLIYSETPIAQKELSGPLALARLDGELELDKLHEDIQYFEGGKVILKADVEGWSSEDWDMLKKWVFTSEGLDGISSDT